MINTSRRLYSRTATLSLLIVCWSLGARSLTASSIVDIKPAIDQELQDNHMDGTFDEFIIVTNSILQTTAFDGSHGVVPVDRRGIMEFNLAPTLSAAQLQSAS